jgi:aminopeptidase N
MKSIFAFSILMVSSFIFAQENVFCRKNHMHFSPPSKSSDDTNTDIIHTEIKWNFNPAKKFISGEVTHTIKAVNQDVQSTKFDLSKKLRVISVSLPTQNTELNFEHNDDSEITFSLPSKLLVSQSLPITIKYDGVPDNTGLGSFTFGNHGGVAAAWNVSPPFGSRDFWPCKNGLTDKIDSLDIYVTSPKLYKAATNGVLVSESSTDTSYTCHWKHKYPIASYLVGLGVTNYVRYTDTVRLKSGIKLPVINYVYPETEASSRAGTTKLLKTLSFFDSLFTDYPFANEKYGHAQFGFGGGMEHQTMSFVTDFSFSLLAHELAHQWFGDLVTCGDWEDTWINEGSATFLEGLAQERFNGSGYYSWKLAKLNSVISQPGGSVKVPPTTSASRVFDGRLTYNKGSMLLHMLRWIMGDKDFFSGLRSFLVERQYGYASTEDLRFHLEKEWAQGQSLKPFFDKWFIGQGYPTYNLTWQQEGNELRVKIDQSTTHSSVNLFELPIPIRVKYKNGSQVYHRLDNFSKSQTYTLPADDEVTKIDFDPDIRIVSRSTVSKGVVSKSDDFYNDVWTIKQNPTSASTIEFSGLDNELRYSITDVLGSVILTGTTSGIIDIHSLKAGNYFIMIGSKMSRFTKL